MLLKACFLKFSFVICFIKSVVENYSKQKRRNENHYAYKKKYYM